MNIALPQKETTEKSMCSISEIPRSETLFAINVTKSQQSDVNERIISNNLQSSVINISSQQVNGNVLANSSFPPTEYNGLSVMYSWLKAGGKPKNYGIIVYEG